MYEKYQLLMSLGGYAFAERLSRLVDNLFSPGTTHLANCAVHMAHDHPVSSQVQMSVGVFQVTRGSGHLQQGHCR